MSSEAPTEAPSDREVRGFRAETRSLLNIVSNALYTEREVFLRELLSNASDALEKARQRQVANVPTADPQVPLEINITVDKETRTLVIEDSGIGMSREELMTNLGTIALSGSKRYRDGLEKGADAAAIIGQFGVGFYSAFMVGDRVAVSSRAADEADAPHRWASDDGAETYSIESAPPQTRGSRVEISVKADADEYLETERLKDVVRKYSNFVSFPIKVNGELVNSVGALWTRSPAEVEEADYNEFYQFAFKGAWDTPIFWNHFRAEAPLDVKALLYFPSFHTEKHGMGRLEPSVSLYSRKVLIESPCVEIVPDWMRFVKGVVDSEDLPLSISREKSQDKRLLAKIQDVVVRKTLRFLLDKAKQDRDAYMQFYREFEIFLKEGACHDAPRRADIAKLLYFDSSSCDREKGEMCSLDEYIGRAKSHDDEIYYLHAPSRELAEASPYYESFKNSGRECLFVYNAIDDFVMSNIGEHNGRKIRTAEAADFADKEAAFAKKKEAETDAKEAEPPVAAADAALSEAEQAELCAWFLRHLDDRVSSCETTTRLVDSPCVVVDAESGAMRRMMALVSQQNQGDALAPVGLQKLQLNPKHAIVKRLHALRAHGTPGDENDLATVVAHQLVDNALVAAGLMDDARAMLPRLNRLLALALK